MLRFFSYVFAFILISTSNLAGAQTGDGDVAPAAKPSEKLSIETFARLPFIENATLSPDATRIAGLFGVRGEQRIVITPLDGDTSKITMEAVPDETEVDWIRWVNSDNVIVGLRGLTRVQTDRWYVSRMVAINHKTGAITRLLWKQMGQNAADVLWIPKDGGNEILVAAQNSIYSSDEDFWPTIYRVNVETGKKKRVLRGKPGVYDWGVDHAGNVRFGIGYSDRNQTSKLLYAKENSKTFRTIDKADLGEEESLTTPFLFVPGSDNALMIKENEEGKSSVIEVNLATRQDVRTVYEAEDADVSRVRLSFDRSKILGVITNGGGLDTDSIWIDPAVKQAQKDLDEAVKNANARIISFNRDQTKMLVRVSTADNPGMIYFYDTNTKALQKFTNVNQTIANRRLNRVRMIKYNARDGLEIEAVLTQPRDREAKNQPLIVMPHGGPWGHDSLRYDYWAQFLANQGYLVPQPNFRGSTGYGDEFVKKGQGQMGLAMQDDITDAMGWAVKQGLADPERVCIMGASYGGYAAMWGVIKDPGLYRCAISIAGVSNLRREVNDFGSSTHAKLFKSQWRKMTPDFKAVSPLNGVSRIKVPLLLIHGRKDVTVDHVQSVKMNAAMKKAGKPVEFVSIPLADHYFTREADRLTLLQSIDRFLQKHNPANQ